MTTDFRDMWRATVERFPDRTAIEVVPTGARMSYADLHRDALCLAERVRDAPTGARRLVGLRIADRQRFCLGLLGTWLADAVAVPLSAGAPRAYVDDLAGRLGITSVLVEEEASPGGVGLALLPHASAPTADPGRVDGLAYVMHTSGSTGRPKAVALSHQALAAYCTAFTAAIGLSRHDRFLQLAPVTFDVVFEELLPIWSVGGTAVLADLVADDPRRLLADIERHGVTVAELTTVYWALLVRHLQASTGSVPASLRLLLMGGELAPPHLIEVSLRLGLPLAHVYGVTEAGITSTVKLFDRERPVVGSSVGTPLANSTVHVVDDGAAPVATGVTGEVWIGGTSLAEGYLDEPGETARRFVELTGDGPLTGRFYRTGDAGRLTEDGELEILGRLDAQVKVNGMRVDLTEVEAALGSSPLVLEAAAVAVEHPGGRHRLHGFVVAADGAETTTLERTLKRFMSETLPDHLVPERIMVLAALPVTAHGKVDRGALAGRTGHQGPQADVETWTPAQRAVADAWTRAVGRPPAGLDQNFGDAGGDSLALLAVVVGLDEVGLPVTSTDCLTHPTVRALAALLDHRATADPAGIQSAYPAPAIEQERREQRGDYLRRRRAAQRGAP